MDARVERLRLNEALFREVNERLREITAAFGRDEAQDDFVCECADVGCTRRLQLDRAEYEAVRASGTQFVVAPGHEVAEIETLVSRNNRFAVVRKHDRVPAPLTDKTAPRE